MFQGYYKQVTVFLMKNTFYTGSCHLRGAVEDDPRGMNVKMFMMNIPEEMMLIPLI